MAVRVLPIVGIIGLRVARYAAPFALRKLARVVSRRGGALGVLASVIGSANVNKIPFLRRKPTFAQRAAKAGLWTAGGLAALGAGALLLRPQH